MAGNFCYRVFFVFLLQVVKKFVPGGNISLSFSSPVAMLFMDHSSPTSEHMLSNVSYLLYTHSLAYSPYSYSCVLNTFFLLLSNFLLSLPTFLLPLSILLLFAFSSLSLSLSITMPFSSCLLNVLQTAVCLISPRGTVSLPLSLINYFHCHYVLKASEDCAQFLTLFYLVVLSFQKLLPGLSIVRMNRKWVWFTEAGLLLITCLVFSTSLWSLHTIGA